MEFDPKSERHYPILIVKAVEPGCTTELQIELCDSGEVRRLTTTDEAFDDRERFLSAVTEAFGEVWDAYERRSLNLEDAINSMPVLLEDS